MRFPVCIVFVISMMYLLQPSVGEEVEFRWVKGMKVLSFRGLHRLTKIFINDAINLTLEIIGVEEKCPFLSFDGNIGSPNLGVTLKR